MSRTDSILAFDTRSEPPGIEIIDRLEQLRYQLQTPESVSPEQVAEEQFLFPVGKGLRIATDELVLPNPVSVIIRDASGSMVAEVEHLERCSLDEGTYILDLSTQIKTYMRISGPVEITADVFEIQFAFEEETVIDIGFRSRHTRPAATVTTTADPEDMMQAVSTFGSALKSTSAERSFPTLRGHPPQIEIGSSLEIPDRLERPETGVSIVVPPEYESIYPVVPLAYYLGATLVPGEKPRITTASGFEYSLDSPAFETAVEETLKQVFVLDCVTRTEGFYDVPLHERSRLDEATDLDWATLYDQSIGERLKRYLSVPYEQVEKQVPKWRLTTHVEPASETIEQLPFVANDLAVVRPVKNPTQTEPNIGANSPDTRQRGFTRSVSRSTDDDRRSLASGSDGDDQSYIEFEPTDSLEQGWIGDGIPIGASKLVAAAFHNRLDREVGVGDISITIVLNDSRMDEERDIVDSVYGDRENLPFDVTICRDLTVDELRQQLHADSHFFHYIGHTEPDGFECADGKLDVTTLDTVGIDSFLLNACQSYHQGLGLIEAGAIGGIVTLTDIINNEAVRVGEIIARLLNTGFPLCGALSIAQEESILGGQYTVVGDGGMTVTQASSRTPTLIEGDFSGEPYVLNIHTFATDNASLGSIYTPFIPSIDTYFLTSGNIGRFALTHEKVAHFLDLENMPVRVGDSLQWSPEILSENLDISDSGDTSNFNIEE